MALVRFWGFYWHSLPSHLFFFISNSLDIRANPTNDFLFIAKGDIFMCSSDPPPTTYLLNQIPLVDTHMDDRHGEFRSDHLNRYFYSSIFSEAKCYSEFSVMG